MVKTRCRKNLLFGIKIAYEWTGCIKGRVKRERLNGAIRLFVNRLEQTTTMKMIQPNCRVQFAAEDIDFILSVLGGKIGTSECLIQLLSDEDSRDLILDDDALLHALLERRGCLRVSSRFYFYILVRSVFRRSDLPDRALADYVAEVLAEFACAERSRCVVPGQGNPLDYF